MKQHWRVAAVAAAVCVALISACLILWAKDNAPNDCATAHALIEYNRQFNQQVEASANWENNSQLGVDDYKTWAGRINELARDIRDPAVATHAAQLAQLADEMVPAVAHYLDESATAPSTQSIDEFSRLGREFDDSLAGLDAVCADR